MSRQFFFLIFFLSLLFFFQADGIGLRRLPEVALFCFPAKGFTLQRQRPPVRAPTGHVSWRSFIPLSALLFLPLNFWKLLQVSLYPLLPAQTKSLIPCQNTFLAQMWIFFFTFSIFNCLYVLFLKSIRHLLLFPSTRWQSLLSLCFLPASFFYIICLEAFWTPHSISFIFSRIQLRSFFPPGRFPRCTVYS